MVISGRLVVLRLSALAMVELIPAGLVLLDVWRSF